MTVRRWCSDENEGCRGINHYTNACWCLQALHPSVSPPATSIHTAGFSSTLPAGPHITAIHFCCCQLQYSSQGMGVEPGTPSTVKMANHKLYTKANHECGLSQPISLPFDNNYSLSPPPPQKKKILYYIIIHTLYVCVFCSGSRVLSLGPHNYGSGVSDIWSIFWNIPLQPPLLVPWVVR